MNWKLFLLISFPSLILTGRLWLHLMGIIHADPDLLGLSCLFSIFNYGGAVIAGVSSKKFY